MRTLALAIALLALNAHAATKPARAPASAAPASAPLDDKPKLVRSDTYACIPAANPQGYNWQDGRWQATGFKEVDRFTLNITVIESAGMQYLHFQRKSSKGDEHCGTLYNVFSFDGVDACSSIGETFVFSKATGRGAVSYALGATDAGDTRDSVYIMPFTCQSF